MVVLDEFDRADSSELGAFWDAGYTGFNNAQIVGGRARATVLDANSYETRNDLTLKGSQFAEAQIATFGGSIEANFGLLIRAAAPATVTWYEVEADRNRGDGITTRLAKRVAGVFTALASETATTWVAGDIIRLEVEEVSGDDRLRVYRNGVLLLSATDPDIGSGRAGIFLFVGAGGSLADCEMERWVAGNLVPTGRIRTYRPRPFAPGLGR